MNNQRKLEVKDAVKVVLFHNDVVYSSANGVSHSCGYHRLWTRMPPVQFLKYDGVYLHSNSTPTVASMSIVMPFILLAVLF